MGLQRRDFLYFLGASLTTVTTGCWDGKSSGSDQSLAQAEGLSSQAPFPPVQVPIPLTIEGLSDRDQQAKFATYDVVDDLVLPEGYTYDVVASWGDPVGDSRFGYNNDYVSFLETSPGEGILTINFEYSGGKTWLETHGTVLGRSLDLQTLFTASAPNQGVLPLQDRAATDPLRQAAEALARELLTDQGIGVITVRQDADGRWVRTFGAIDRRITGLSGLDNDHSLGCTGPAAGVFRKANKWGYEDGLGDRIIGSFQNCAGGTTPWGTVFSAEENIQSEVIEAVWADGSAIDPQQQPFYISPQGARRSGTVFNLAGNKYGWIVEVDPRNPQDYGTKHTWLGRFHHEAVAIRAVDHKPLALYSGCDRQGGHFYKFISDRPIQTATDPNNSRLLESGMLYGAKFNPDGTGTWIPLNPDTPVDPLRPSTLLGQNGQSIVLLPNPSPEQPGYGIITQDEQALAYQAAFPTLGSIYQGDTPELVQGAILIDAHYAANAAGITATARPEDTQVDPSTGTLYIAFTSGSASGDGGPDGRIFKGPAGEIPYAYGWVMKVEEDQGDPAALSFRWQMFALGGEPFLGGAGFSNPDNLEIDGRGNVWIVTDISGGAQNQAILSRPDHPSDGRLLGVFGNNSAWMIPTHGAGAGEAYPFAIAPMESELCGIFMTPDQKTLFLAPQHPGEVNGQRRSGATEQRQLALTTTGGQVFQQIRTVPLGSNWPGKGPTDPPKPSVVAVRRLDGGTIVP